MKREKVLVVGNGTRTAAHFVEEGEVRPRRRPHQTTVSPCCCGGGCWLCCWSEEEFGVADEELFEESKLLFPLLLLLPPPAKERGKKWPFRVGLSSLGSIISCDPTHLLLPRCPGNLDRPD